MPQLARGPQASPAGALGQQRLQFFRKAASQLPKIELLIDTFTTQDAYKWTTGIIGAGSTASVSGGVLVCSITSAAFSVAEFDARDQFWTLVDSSMLVALVQAYAGTAAAAGAETYFVMQFGPNTNLLSFKVQADGPLNAIMTLNGAETQLATTTYSSATHAWLRLRESGGTVYWETATSSAQSPPLQSEWTVFTSRSTDSVTFPIRGIPGFIVLGADVWGTPGAQTKTAQFDNLNIPASTGTSYSDTVAETATPVDVTDAFNSMLVSVAETSTPTDAPTVTRSSTESVSETATVTDAPTVARSSSESVSETATPTETESAAFAFPVAVTETATVDDAYTVARSATPSISETATPTDAATATGTFNHTISETATPTDSPSATGTFNHSVSETATPTDAPTVTRSSTESVSETAPPTDAPTVARSSSDSVSETAAVTDAPTVVRASSLSVSETATVTDAESVIGSFNHTVNETASVTDVTDSTATGNQNATISESLTISEVWSGIGSFHVSFSDALLVVDAFSTPHIVSWEVISTLDTNTWAAMATPGTTWNAIPVTPTSSPFSLKDNTQTPGWNSLPDTDPTKWA